MTASPLSRARLAVALLVLVPLGLLTKSYRGPAQVFVNDFFCGVPYVIFWVLLVLFVRPALPPRKAALGVFLATSALECLQLWHPPFLTEIRSTWVGGTLLGTTFHWLDFPFYALGCAVSMPLCRALRPSRA